MPRDEHSHEIISELLGRSVLPSHINEEAQQTRVLDDIVVSALELLHLALILRAQRLRDQLVQHVVE